MFCVILVHGLHGVYVHDYTYSVDDDDGRGCDDYNTHSESEHHNDGDDADIVSSYSLYNNSDCFAPFENNTLHDQNQLIVVSAYVPHIRWT